MSDLMQKIQETVKREGIDLIGFAPKARFDALPAEKNPFTIFPEAKTVIMLGKRICRGSLRGIEEGTNFEDYRLFGANWLEDEFLATACYNLTLTLESEGWEACPLFPNPSEIAPTGVSVAPGRPAPNVFPDFTYAAVACGLCELGRSGLLLSPKFGSRQRFHMIITDAELEATPLLTKSVCDGCGLCARVCPLDAYSEETETVDICGKKMEVYKRSEAKCRVCKNGACPNRLSSQGSADRIAALCNRTCMCHLEEAGLVENRFEQAFRQNDAWAISEAGTPASKNSGALNVLGGVLSANGK